MNPYSYSVVEPCFNLHLKETTRSWWRYTVDFPIAQPTRHQENNTGHGEYFRPREGHNGPLAILIHGWGDRSVIPCKLLAKALVKRGIACFVLYLVFHSSRMPEVMRNRFPSSTPCRDTDPIPSTSRLASAWDHRQQDLRGPLRIMENRLMCDL